MELVKDEVLKTEEEHRREEREQARRREEIRRRIEELMVMTKDSLLVMFRFLDRAVGTIGLQAVDGIFCFCTDGEFLYYDPAYVPIRVQDDTPLERDFLHMILHLVFAHPFHAKDKDIELWNLACDIAVEHAVMDSGMKGLRSKSDEEQMIEIEKFHRAVEIITAERVYRYLLRNPLSADEVSRLHRLFVRDEHFTWYNQVDIDEDEIDRQDYEGINVVKSRKEFQESANRNFDEEISEERKRKWETVTKHIEMEREMFDPQFGDAWGSLTQNIGEVRKDSIDYKHFLQDFAAMGEEMLVNNDEFDYIYYNYGMELYGNIPLIEPLEYRNEKRIREFAIVLDTSGSCTGDIVQSFLEKTYSILLTEETFSNKVNIHIIQCDTRIQQDTKIQSFEDLEEFLKTEKLTGFGGTDFRPAFSYIDHLVEKKEFENLRGILYFTDGYGTYPVEIPDYKTVFVFVDTGMATPNVPPWAMKVVLEEERLRKE